MIEFPEPTQWNGSDPRSFSGRPATPTQLFWRAYAFAVREHLVCEFFRIYRPIPIFAELVAEAERREAMRIKEREQ